MSTSQNIDWKDLAERLNLLHANGESASHAAARQALEWIIGNDPLKHAVDYYIGQGAGSELVRAVLAQLRPVAAIERCLEI